MIREIQLSDAKSIAEIYNHYIENSVITFEEDPVTENEMLDRIRAHDVKLPWIVYEDQDDVTGYAYATAWKGRSAYRYSVESTVYVRPDKKGNGVGTRLYQELLSRIKKGPVHVVIGGISLPNKASVALHEKLGFEKVAHFKEVGCKFDEWIDVGYWELVIT